VLLPAVDVPTDSVPYRRLTGFDSADFLIGFFATLLLTPVLGLGIILGLFAKDRFADYKFLIFGVNACFILLIASVIICVTLVLGALAVCFYSVSHPGR
jgi:hypothetical protein